MKKIPLNRDYEAIVDDRDYDELIKCRWSTQIIRRGDIVYAQRRFKTKAGLKTISMHRQILCLYPGNPIWVDHVNGNGLDNRRENLRFSSRSENQRNRRSHKNNTSGYRGVVWRKRHPVGWVAKIGVNGSKIFLGRFIDKESAARAYDEAAKKYHGPFARLNFPESA